MNGAMAAPPIWPYLDHRHMGEVIADEAINRRARARYLLKSRERNRRYREARAAAA